MQGLNHYKPVSDGRTHPHLTRSANSLTIDVEETAERRIQRLVLENPVVILSRSSCFMCLVVKNLLISIGTLPRLIELDEDEITNLNSRLGIAVHGGTPAVFVGGDWLGGLESIVALHLSGYLVPKLVEAGALGGTMG